MSPFRITCRGRGELAVRGVRIAGHALDLSEGGMQFLCAHAFPIGTRLAFLLALPDGGRIAGRGEVRWHVETSDGRAIGIQFIRLGPRPLGRLRDTLSAALR